jgi:hypothetical protein
MQWFIYLQAAIILGILIVGIARQSLFGIPFSNHAASTKELVFLAVFCSFIMGVIVVMTRTMVLKVEVDGKEVRIGFVPYAKRVVPITDIARADAVQYRPIGDCGGWGVRFYKWKGWCYTISGNKGVEIATNKGKLLLIGSQRHEELAAVIRRHMGMGV